MRRAVSLLLVCLLALTTGLALLRAGALIAEPAPPAGSRSAVGAAAANTALVGRFYAAVNAALRSGDPTPVADLLAADFVDRTPPPGVAPTRDGLVQHVIALRATLPALQLTADDLLAQGDLVLAWVRTEGAAPGMFLGLPLAGPPATWEARHLFRIAGDRIAERWGGGDWPLLAAPLVEAPLAEPPPAAILRLARFTFGPGAQQVKLSELGPLLLAVEAGALTAQVEGHAVLTRGAAAGTSGPQPTIVPSGTDIVLHPGDGLWVAPGIRPAFRNTAETPAVVLAATLLPWWSADPADPPEGTAFIWPVPGALDISAQLLLDGVVTDFPPAPSVLGVGRLTLAAGTGLAPYVATGPQFAFVEAGTLGVASIDAGPAALFSAGAVAFVQDGAVVTLRNPGDGSLVLLLVTITPADM
jgi:quercetin dioxygenase-like cupin family protein/predicted ester cyclase